jgi:hypothetical protein
MARNRPSKALHTPIEGGGGDRLRAVRAHLVSARAALDQAAAGLSDALGDALGSDAARRRGPNGDGLRGKLCRDSEVREYVEARLDYMRYADIAAATRAAFGPTRGVGASTVQRWWKKKFAPSK